MNRNRESSGETRTSLVCMSSCHLELIRYAKQLVFNLFGNFDIQRWRLSLSQAEVRSTNSGRASPEDAQRQWTRRRNLKPTRRRASVRLSANRVMGLNVFPVCPAEC